MRLALVPRAVSRRCADARPPAGPHIPVKFWETKEGEQKVQRPFKTVDINDKRLSLRVLGRFKFDVVLEFLAQALLTL